MSTRAFALTDSPFAVLGVSPRAGREQIEAALARHPSRPRAIADLLLDVRARLSHELAWLQGLSGGAADETLKLASGGYREQIAARLNNLRGLNKANLAAHAADRFSDPAFVDVLARAWEGIDTAGAAARVNEERAVAGLPPTTEAQVVWALQEVRERHAATAARVLSRNGEDPAAVSALVHRSAATESDSGRRFVDAVVAAYGDQQAEPLEALEQGLINEADRLTRSGSIDLLRFEAAMSRWRTMIQPLRDLAAARGREETRSLRLVGDLRSVYLDPSPGAARIAPAQEIGRRLLAEFPQSMAVQRMVSGDLARLGSLPAPPPAPAPEIARTGSVGDRADVRRQERERMSRGRGAAEKARRPAVPASSSPARRAQPSVPASATPAPAVLRDQMIAGLRRQADAAASRARVLIEEANAQPRKKKGGVGGLLFVGFVILMSWIGRALDDDGDTSPPPETVASAPVRSDAEWAASVASMLASADRPPEVMPQPGEAELTLEEANYCLMTQRRITGLQSLAEAPLQERVAALDRDYESRCGGRRASAEALPAWQTAEREAARTDADVVRILEVWRAG